MGYVFENDLFQEEQKMTKVENWKSVMTGEWIKNLYLIAIYKIRTPHGFCRVTREKNKIRKSTIGSRIT